MSAKSSKKMAAAVSIALMGMSSASYAASIGINFVGGAPNNSTMAPGTSAGLVPQTNFNNVTGGNGTAVGGLNDSTGTAVPGLSLTFTSGGGYTALGGGDVAGSTAGGDEQLNDGYIYGDATVKLTGIPYAKYNVIVYELNDGAGRTETTSDGASTFYGISATPNDSSHIDGNAATPYVYTQSTGLTAATATPNGDYVLFTGETASALTITDTAPGNGYLNGIQIVAVTPEPASISVLGLGSLGLLKRRRKAR